jgi:DNA-binding transcriptional MerR regulator
MAGVKPTVIRFWETEFPEIAPKKSKSGHRVYEKREVEKILAIRELLYREKYSIEGAKRRLRQATRSAVTGDGGGLERAEALKHLRGAVDALLDWVSVTSPSAERSKKPSSDS